MKMRFLSVFAGLLALIIIPMVGCSQSNSLTNQTQPTLRNSNLLDGVMLVKTGSYYDMPFLITSSMTNSSVTGSFKASGDSENDIIALVLDDTSFTNWVNGQQANALYNSGQITTANINVPITTPGKYHLVFSNEFSTISSKQVSTLVNLQWYQ